MVPHSSLIKGRGLWSCTALIAAVLALWQVEETRLNGPQDWLNREVVVHRLQRRTEGLWLIVRTEGVDGDLGVSAPHDHNLREGDRIQLSGTLEPATWRGSLIGFIRPKTPPKLLQRSNSLRHRLRQGYRQLCQRHLERDSAALMPALLLGDRELFEGPRQRRFRLTGTLHYLALSGLHLGLLILPLIVLLRALRISPRQQLLIALPGVLIYLWLTGPIPSLVRAVITLCLLAAAHLFRRGLDTISALLAAMTLCLILQPSQITSAGFAMTFAALAGILLIGPRLAALAPDLKSHWLWHSLCLNAGAWLTIGPVLLWTFGEIHPVALVLNLLLVPIVTGLLITSLLLPIVPQIIAPVVDALWNATDRLLELSLSQGVRPLGPDNPQLAAVLGCMIVLGIGWKRTSPRRLAAATLASVLALASLPADHETQHPRVTQINVGQGSSYLIEDGQGGALFVDCGGSRRKLGERYLVPALRQRGIDRLEGLILTHLDRDHRSGLEDLLARWPVGWIGWNPKHSNPIARAEVEQLAARHHIPFRHLIANDRWLWNGLSFTIWHPAQESPGPENERSLVVHVQGPRRSILFTGDIDDIGTRNLLQRQRLPQVDLVTAPHHGSANRWTELLLLELKPQHIWLSARETFPTQTDLVEHPDCLHSWNGDLESPL